ncbi:MAG: DNA-directed RNA polymerase subunit alpha [Candidatus Paceibacterota bacterium]
MPDFNIILPSKPIIVSEKGNLGIFEIEGLYPGYGHTLGNSLRRIILSSLPGYTITSIKIKGANHEFATLDGIKEDVITIILNLKKIRFKVVGDEPKTVALNIKGIKDVTAGDITVSGDIEVVNKDQYIAAVTDKNTTLDIEMTLEKGLGYVPKEIMQKDKVEIGTIAMDAIFTPIRRVSYEVDQMRVGNRTDYNKLRLTIETNGDVSPKEALEQSIAIMINQLRAIVGFKEELEDLSIADESKDEIKAEIKREMPSEDKTVEEDDVLKTRISDLDLSTRTDKALANASIRTIGGLIRKKEEDLIGIEGLGDKGIQEIKRALSNFGIVLK